MPTRKCDFPSFAATPAALPEPELGPSLHAIAASWQAEHAGSSGALAVLPPLAASSLGRPPLPAALVLPPLPPLTASGAPPFPPFAGVPPLPALTARPPEPADLSPEGAGFVPPEPDCAGRPAVSGL